MLVILLAIAFASPAAECVDNLMKTIANITVWPAFESKNSSTIVLGANEMIPSTIECHHNGKSYKQGENWSSGHLRYQCKKFGAYTILGCRTNDDRPLKIGETYIDDFIAHMCFQDGATTYYRESACDLAGQPSCDSFRKNPAQVLPLAATSGATSGIIDQTHGFPAVAGLPQGWKIVDSRGSPIPLSRVRVISSIMGPMQSTQTIHRTAKRQTGKGVATVIGIPIDDEMKKERVVGVGTGSVSLDSRRPTVSLDKQKMKPGTVSGTVSELNWVGKTAMLNGKRIAVGPGTFTFGNRPTGTFFHKND